MSSLNEVGMPLEREAVCAAPSSVSVLAGYGRWELMMHRRRTRNALLQLDDAQLRDVGLTREQARQQGSKPFWRD